MTIHATMKEGQRDLIRRFRLEHDDDWQGTRKEVRDWAIARFHGEGRAIGQVISIMTVNRKSRENRRKYDGEVVDIFFQLGEGKDAMLRFYSPGDKPYYEFGKKN
jgi:hypothetical protein